MFELDSGWFRTGETAADTPIFNALQQRSESSLVSDIGDIDLSSHVPSQRTDPVAEFRRDPLAAPVPVQAYVEVPAPSKPVDLQPVQRRVVERGGVTRLPVERVPSKRGGRRRLPAEHVPSEPGPVSRFPASVISTPAMAMVRPWETDPVPVQTPGRHRHRASEQRETSSPTAVIPAVVIITKRAAWPQEGH